MKHKSYDVLKITDDLSIFEFISIGQRGHVHKRIVFMPSNRPEVRSLALLDKDMATGEFIDTSISDNGDRNKILATVEHAIDAYTQKYPDRWIHFKGNTAQRTRLYRMAVGINFDELSLKYNVYAVTGGNVIPFSKNMDLDGFLITRKKM